MFGSYYYSYLTLLNASERLLKYNVQIIPHTQQTLHTQKIQGINLNIIILSKRRSNIIYSYLIIV